MRGLLQRLQDMGEAAWLRFVQWLNWIALTLGGLILAVNTMFPRAVEEAASALPPAAKFAALALWAALVHYSLNRAKAAPSAPTGKAANDA